MREWESGASEWGEQGVGRAGGRNESLQAKGMVQRIKESVDPTATPTAKRGETQMAERERMESGRRRKELRTRDRSEESERERIVRETNKQDALTT